MNKQYDAIIIGSGIMGCAIAFELAKRGYRTLNIDKLPTAGYGSTSNSCAIIRVHYSTWDGVGHMMAELIKACEAGHDHDTDPVKVKMPYTGLELNVGFYSRLREINKNSSFSVLG